MILFRANRAYMHQLVEHLPEAWERYILFRWYFAQEAGKRLLFTVSIPPQSRAGNMWKPLLA